MIKYDTRANTLQMQEQRIKNNEHKKLFTLLRFVINNPSARSKICMLERKPYRFSFQSESDSVQRGFGVITEMCCVVLVELKPFVFVLQSLLRHALQQKLDNVQDKSGRSPDDNENAK